MKPRLLVLTAGFGEGHNAAARAIVAATEEVHGPGSAYLADVFALTAPRLNEFVRRAYLGLIRRQPDLWRRLYGWLDDSAYSARLMDLLGAERRTLGRLIDRTQPSAICATYPAYAYLLARLQRNGRELPPVFNVVTDSISINSLWWRAECDGWFVPNEDSASVMRAAGVDESRLHPLGFPVAPFFRAHQAQLAPPDLRSGALPRVLYIINSERPVAGAMAKSLLRETNWAITCTVGQNERLREELAEIATTRGHPTRILGWTKEIPELLMTHHVVVSKAGGATTQEAIAARCPMIVNQIVPGQEEGNYELLRRHGIGTLAEDPATLLAALQRAFARQGRGWQAWRHAVTTLARPEAARDIVAAIVAHGGRTRRAAAPHPLGVTPKAGPAFSAAP